MLKNAVNLTFEIAVNDPRGTRLNQNEVSQRISRLSVRRALPATASLMRLTL